MQLVCSFDSRRVSMTTGEIAVDSPFASILERANVVDAIKVEDYEEENVPSFQRVTITGEETSGVGLVVTVTERDRC